MDAIFGHQNFQNEIIWHYRRWTGKAKRFQRLHDVILFYTKTNQHTFNPLYTSYTEKSLKRKQNYHTRIKGDDIYVTSIDKKGVRENDVWQIPILNSQSKERLGYPTQKPIALLKHVIEASSNEGDIVLDPFCGCATTICAAHELNRNWIGIDIAYHAITKVVRSRLYDVYGLHENKGYQVDGIPKTKESAIDMWERDKYQFQRWAVEMVEGFVTTKRGHDGGIDGRIYFQTGNKQYGSMIVEVKGGASVGINVVKELRGVLERDGCEMAGLITRGPLGNVKMRNFQKEMGAAGFIKIQGKELSRMQLLTLDEILEGRKFQTPFAEAKGHRQGKLDL
jgi:site-specific DNA-methyltransferase (adenine-specific)